MSIFESSNYFSAKTAQEQHLIRQILIANNINYTLKPSKNYPQGCNFVLDKKDFLRAKTVIEESL